MNKQSLVERAAWLQYSLVGCDGKIALERFHLPGCIA